MSIFSTPFQVFTFSTKEDLITFLDNLKNTSANSSASSLRFDFTEIIRDSGFTTGFRVYYDNDNNKFYAKPYMSSSGYMPFDSAEEVWQQVQTKINNLTHGGGYRKIKKKTKKRKGKGKTKKRKGKGKRKSRSKQRK